MQDPYRTNSALLIGHNRSFTSIVVPSEGVLHSSRLHVQGGEVIIEITTEGAEAVLHFGPDPKLGSEYRLDEGCSKAVRLLFGVPGLLRMPKALLGEMVLLTRTGNQPAALFDVRELFMYGAQVNVLRAETWACVQVLTPSGSVAGRLVLGTPEDHIPPHGALVSRATLAGVPAYLFDDGAELLLARLRALGATFIPLETD